MYASHNRNELSDGKRSNSNHKIFHVWYNARSTTRSNQDNRMRHRGTPNGSNVIPSNIHRLLLHISRRSWLPVWYTSSSYVLKYIAKLLTKLYFRDNLLFRKNDISCPVQPCRAESIKTIEQLENNLWKIDIWQSLSPRCVRFIRYWNSPHTSLQLSLFICFDIHWSFLMKL